MNPQLQCRALNISRAPSSFCIASLYRCCNRTYSTTNKLAQTPNSSTNNTPHDNDQPTRKQSSPKYKLPPGYTNPSDTKSTTKNTPSKYTHNSYSGSPQAFYSSPPPSTTRQVYPSELSRPRNKFYPPPKRKAPTPDKIYDSTVLFSPSAEFIQRTKNITPKPVTDSNTNNDFYDSTTFLKHEHKLSKLSKARHIRAPRTQSKWAKEEPPEEVIDYAGEEGEIDDIVNYWDRASKKRASMQDKYKQDLLDLMKRRMVSVELVEPSTKTSKSGPAETKQSLVYTEEELACMANIKDPIWRALSSIRPPYRSHDNYLNFLAEKLHNKANTESYNTILQYTVHSLKLDLSEHLFDDMLKSGISPNTETFNWMIKAYMQACHVDKAVTYFSQMLKHNAPPNLTTYAFMIHGFMDNSMYSQAHSLLSPAQSQYDLSFTNESFEDLKREFKENPSLDFRVWLSQFLPDASKQRGILDKIEYVSGKGTKIDGKFVVTHRSVLNAVLVVVEEEGKERKEGKKRTISIKNDFRQHVSKNIRAGHLEILSSMLPFEIDLDKDGIPLSPSLSLLLSRVRARVESEKKKREKEREMEKVIEKVREKEKERDKEKEKQEKLKQEKEKQEDKDTEQEETMKEQEEMEKEEQKEENEGEEKKDKEEDQESVVVAEKL